MQQHKKRIVGFVLVVMLGIIGFTGLGSVYAQEKPTTVRVGYIDYQGFIEANANGAYSGYCVSYLNEVAKITGWKYTFVQDSWSNLLERLKSGDIDMLCSAQYTEERAVTFDYSSNPLGVESCILYVRPSDTSIYFNDYTAMNGRKVGLLADNFQNETFTKYADGHFTYEPLYYHSDGEMVDALNAGTVDMIVTGSLSYHNELKAVAQFGADPFYCITRKGNTALLDSLNAAIDHIKVQNPYFESKLIQKYYQTTSTSTTPLFTREEADYVKTAKPITLGILPNLKPMAAYTDGDFCGVNVDIAKAIAEKSGLTFNYVALDPGERPADALRQQKCDLVIGANRTDQSLQYDDIQLSNSYMAINSVAVARNGEDVNTDADLTVAIIKSYASAEYYVNTYHPNYTILTLDSPDDVLSAVLNKEADIAILNNYMADYHLQNPHFEELAAFSTISYEENPCFMGMINVDPMVFKVLNKTIASMGSDETNSIIMANTISKAYRYTFMDTVYKYRFYWGTILISGIGIACLVYFLVRRQRQNAVLLADQADLKDRVKRAQMDTLTQVYTKEAFYAEARTMLDAQKGETFAIIALDVERFKIINELFGIEEGDRFLKAMAQGLKETARDDGITGRLDSDNFVLCVRWSPRFRDDFRDAFHEFLASYPLDFNISVRCGVYLVDELNTPINLMCDRANMAAEQVRGSDLSHFAYYDDAQRQALLEEQLIINEMDHALESGEFTVYYQGKFEANTGKITGSEALVRWIHPTRGIISPGVFIPVFERNGFIMKLDHFVWEETCRQLKEWQDAGLPTFPVSVNMSRIHLYDEGVCAYFMDLVAKYAIDPALLEIEVTETAFLENPLFLTRTIDALQGHGFSILMDDFGSGYSSLNVLRELHVDVLKIDMRFIRDLEDNPRSKPIVEAIVRMAHSLHLPVIVEGVETKAQLDYLIGIHADQVQGFYFARPLPVSSFTPMLTARS